MNKYIVSNRNEFKAYVNKLNQITIPKDIREKHNIEQGDDVLLEFKGKIQKTEKIIKPKEGKNETK